ncbi:uncharacterized protein [Clytia hemisphaerica]
MASKRKSITCYINQTSPMKRKHINFKMQTSSNQSLRRGICFNTDSCPEFKSLESSGKAITLRNVKEVVPDNPNFAEIIFDDHSTIEVIAPGSMSFERHELKSAPKKTVNEIASQPFDPMDNSVTVRGVVTHDKKVVNRGGFELLEGIFADSTGQMPISIWSSNIEIFVKNSDSCFEMKNVAIKERNGILTLTTNSNSTITANNPDKKFKVLYEKLRKTPIKPTDTIKGKIKFMKDFTCGSRCSICTRLVQHALTSHKFRCVPCNSIQPVESVSKKVILGVDHLNLILHSEVWNYTLFGEEEISDFLLGKFVDVTYVVESNEITIIKLADQDTSGSGNLEIVKTAAKQK